MRTRLASVVRSALLLLPLSLALAPALRAAETPTSFGPVATVEESILRIPKVTKPPTIDGVFEAGEWEASTAFCCFWYPQVELSIDPAFLAGKQVRPRLHVGYDDANLYFAFVSPVYPESTWFRARGRFHDVWMHPLYGILDDDHYELELRPFADHRVGFTMGLFKFIVNPLGSYSDQFWSQQAGEGLSWEAAQYGAKVVSNVGKTEWVVEYLIPYKALLQGRYAEKTPAGEPVVKLPPPDGTVYRCWFTRGIGGGGTFWQMFDHHIWNTTKTMLVFDSQAPHFQLLDLGPLLEDMIDVRLAVRNPGAKSQSVRIGFFVENPVGNIYSSYAAEELKDGILELKPGEVRELRLRQNLPGIAADGNVIWLDVRAAGTPAKILFRTRLIPFHSMDGGRAPLPKGLSEKQLGPPGEDKNYSYFQRRLFPIALLRPPRKDFEFTWQFEAYTGKIAGFVDVGAAHVPREVKQAQEVRFTVVTADADEKTVAEAKTTLANDFATFAIDLNGKIVEGEKYQLNMLIFDANRRIVGEENPPPFTYRREVWYNNKFGLDDVVWEPFTPMVATATGFKTLKHEFTLAPSGLPAQVWIQPDPRELPFEQRAKAAAGEELPATLLREIGRGNQWRSPWRVEVVVGGQRLVAEPVAPATCTREWQSEREYTAQLKAGPLLVDLRTTYDCDGAMRVHLEYHCPTPAEVELFELVAEPLGRVDLRIATTASSGGEMTGAPVWELKLPTDEGIVWESGKDEKPALYYSRMTPFLWFGSGDRAWTYFCDTDRGMVLDRDGSQMSLARNAQGDVTWRIKLVNHPAKLDRRRAVDFTVLTHPAKPRPANGRRIAWFNQGSVGDGYMSENLGASFAAYQAGTRKALPDDRMWTGEQRLPLYRYGWWRNVQAGLPKMNILWEDKATYYFETFVRVGRRCGWWMDEYFPVSMGRSENVAIGDAYLRDPADVKPGEVPWQSGFVTAHMRNHYKRLARIQKANDVPLRQITWANNAATMLESFLWDAWLVEECGGGFRDHQIDVITQFPMSLFTYWSRHFSGTLPRLAWDDTQARAGDDWRAVRQYLGLALLNDYGVAPSGPHGSIVYPEQAITLLRALEKFGAFNDDTEFIPHWRTAGLVRYGQPAETAGVGGDPFSTIAPGTVDPLTKVYVSVYRRPLDDGQPGAQALIVILNASDTAQRERLYITQPERVYGGPNQLTPADVAANVDASFLPERGDWNQGTPKGFLQRGATYRIVVKNDKGQDVAKMVTTPVLMDVEGRGEVPQPSPEDLRGKITGEVYDRVYVPYHDYRVLYGRWSPPKPPPPKTPPPAKPPPPPAKK